MSVVVPSLRPAIAVPGWAKNELWRKAEAVPSLDLRFADSKSLVDATTGANLVDFSRATGGTYVDSQGVFKTALVDEPRFDHDPTTGESLGLLVEGSRTNLLLSSAALATQTVTVAAVAHTLSFYGTGSVALSGTHVATVNGSGAYPTRTTLTFTPTAGSLTLTVTGAVQYANLEEGSFATSYIENIDTPGGVTRAADVASISGSNFSSWASNTAFTVFTEAASASGAAYTGYVYTIGADFNNSVTHYRQADFQPVARVRTAGVDEYGAIGNGAIWTGTSRNRFALALSATSGRQASNGSLSAGADDTSIALPAMSSMSIGSMVGSLPLNGHIRRLTYWGQRLPNSILQAITQ